MAGPSSDRDFELMEYIDWDEGRDFPEDEIDESDEDGEQDEETTDV